MKTRIANPPPLNKTVLAFFERGIYFSPLFFLFSFVGTATLKAASASLSLFRVSKIIVVFNVQDLSPPFFPFPFKILDSAHSFSLVPYAVRTWFYQNPLHRYPPFPPPFFFSHEKRRNQTRFFRRQRSLSLGINLEPDFFPPFTSSSASNSPS